METVKSTAEYTVFKKRSGRYGVQNAAGKWVNGADKEKILLGESLITVSKSSAPAEEAPAEEATEAPAAEAEAPAEESAE